MSRTRLSSALLGSAVVLMSVLAATVHADPLPGRDILKFSQKPMVVTPIPNANGTVDDFFGHDEWSTAYIVFDSTGTGNIIGYSGQFMADQPTVLLPCAPD